MKYKMVYIKWRDAYGVGSDWEEIDESTIKDKPVFCESIGFLVKDGDCVKVLTPHIAHATEIGESKDQGCGDMTIPVSSIVDMKELYEGLAPPVLNHNEKIDLQKKEDLMRKKIGPTYEISKS